MKLGVLRPTLAHVPAEPHGAKIDFDFRYMGSDMPTLLSTQARSGPATMWQDDGTLGWGPCNVLLQSNDFDTTWAPTRAVLSSVANDMPPGLSKSWHINDDGSNPVGTGTVYVTQSLSVLAGVPYTVSVYAKADQTSFINIRSFSYDVTGSYGSWFDLANGATGTINHDDAGIAHAGDGWYRCWITFTTTADVAGTIYIYCCQVDNAYSVDLDGASSIIIAGAQAHPGPLQPYLPTTTAARYLLRNELSPFTGRRGLLMEGQRTNLVVDSSDLTTWVVANINAFGAGSVSNAIAAPDGTTTADFITEDVANATHTIRPAVMAVTNGTAYTASVFVKAGTRTHCLLAVSGGFTFSGIQVDLTAGTAALGTGVPANIFIEAHSGGWYRIGFTATATSTTNTSLFVYLSTDGVFANRTYAGDGTSGLYVWGGQFEAGEMPSSYIPTAAAVATRTADTCAYTLPAALATALSAAGTMLVEFDYAGAGSAAADGGRMTMLIDGGAAANRHMMSNSNSYPARGYTAAAGVGGYSNGSGALAVNTIATAAYAFAAGSQRLATDGSLNGTGAWGAPAVTHVRVGGYISAGYELFGHIYRIRIWDHRLTDAEIQAVTA